MVSLVTTDFITLIEDNHVKLLYVELHYLDKWSTNLQAAMRQGTDLLTRRSANTRDLSELKGYYEKGFKIYVIFYRTYRRDSGRMLNEAWMLSLFQLSLFQLSLVQLSSVQLSSVQLSSIPMVTTLSNLQTPHIRGNLRSNLINAQNRHIPPSNRKAQSEVTCSLIISITCQSTWTLSKFFYTSRRAQSMRISSNLLIAALFQAIKSSCIRRQLKTGCWWWL